MDSIETKVAVLETELNQMGELFYKLDATIDKMTDISNSINQMLAVHDQRISQNQEDTEDLFHLVEKRRIEHDDNLRQLHKRITEGNKELHQEMNTHILKVMHGLEELKDLMIEREKDVRRDQAELEGRIADLEKKNWFFMGAAAVIGFIVGAFDWIAQLFS